MSREIKFRVWDKFVKKMFLWHELNAFSTQPGSIKQWFTDSDMTVQQYTGLKDKNGFDIYEDDIIEYKDVGNLMESGYYIVEYYGAGFTPLSEIQASKGIEWPSKWAVNKTVKVVGNIHENPDFFKQLMEKA